MNKIIKYLLTFFHKWRQLIVILLMKIELIQWEFANIHNERKNFDQSINDFVRYRWNCIDNKREPI
jgi:hypothetical protein